QAVQSGVTMDAPITGYCPGTAVADAIQQLKSKGWTINNAGEATDCEGGGAVITPGDPGNFITTWKTDNPGTSQDNQITIPTVGTGYLYHVYWEKVDDP